MDADIQRQLSKRIGRINVVRCIAFFGGAFLLLPLAKGQIHEGQSFSSSSASTNMDAGEGSTRAPQEVIVKVENGIRPFSRIGIEFHLGTTGPGIDIAAPLSRHFNLRASSDFFIVSTSFEEQGVNIAAKMRLQASRTSLDWFPWAGSFRIIPLLVYANNTHLAARAVVPQGETMTLDGNDFVSSVRDPLRGSASVDFRRVAPGISLGFGNLVPRVSEKHHPRQAAHFSFPVEAGFFYVGQPKLTVDFTGSACDPSQPQAIGCEPVNQDKEFQTGLAKFETRNRKNLSYASFYPLVSSGIGFAF
jgi:hypothetical protein